MHDIKRVSDYSRIDMETVLDLPFDRFMMMNKNAYILLLQQSDEGREYLDDCKRLNTTSIDLEGLEKAFRKDN